MSFCIHQLYAFTKLYYVFFIKRLLERPYFAAHPLFSAAHCCLSYSMFS